MTDEWNIGLKLSIAALLFAPNPIWAYCVGWDTTLPNYDPKYYSVAHEYRRAKYVIRARVVRETWLGEDGQPKALKPPFQFKQPRPWGFDPYLGAFYEVQVESSLKGKAPATIRLFSANSTARFWLKIGSENLLFVSEGAFDEPVGNQMTIDTCGNSKTFPAARGLLPAIRQNAR